MHIEGQRQGQGQAPGVNYPSASAGSTVP